MKQVKALPQIGWREWLALPSLSVKAIKVKVDTGARTSALHVTNLEIKKVGKARYATFKVHPDQNSSLPAIECKVKLVEHRKIKSSSGHESVRPVIKVPMVLGDHSWESEITLVNRDMMGFRMLLGREAVRHRFVVNPGASFLFGREKKGRVLGKKKVKKKVSGSIAEAALKTVKVKKTAAKAE